MPGRDALVPMGRTSLQWPSTGLLSGLHQSTLSLPAADLETCDETQADVEASSTRGHGIRQLLQFLAFLLLTACQLLVPCQDEIARLLQMSKPPLQQVAEFSTLFCFT